MRFFVSTFILIALSVWSQAVGAETMAEFCKSMQVSQPTQEQQKKMAALVKKGLDPCPEVRVTGSSPQFNLSPVLNGNVINSEFQKWSTESNTIKTTTPWSAYSAGANNVVVPSNPKFDVTNKTIVWTERKGGGDDGDSGGGDSGCTRTSNTSTGISKDGTATTVEIVRNGDCSVTTTTTTITKGGDITIVATTTDNGVVISTVTTKGCKDPVENPVSEMCGNCESTDAAGVVRNGYCCINLNVDKCSSSDNKSFGKGNACVCDASKGTSCVSGKGVIINNPAQLANGEIAASVCNEVNPSECTVIKKSTSNPPNQSKPREPMTTEDVPGSLSQAGFEEYASSLVNGGIDAGAVFPVGDKVYSRAEITGKTFSSAESPVCNGSCNDSPLCDNNSQKCQMAGTAGKTPKLGAMVRALPAGYPGVRDYGYSEDFVLNYLFYYTNLFNPSFTSAHYSTLSDTLIGTMAGVSTTPARTWGFGKISEPNAFNIKALVDIIGGLGVATCPKPGGSIGDADTKIDPPIPTLAVIVSDAYPRGIVGIVTRNNGTTVDIIASNWLKVDQCSAPNKSKFGSNNCYQHGRFNSPTLVTNIPLKNGDGPGISYLINLNK